MSAAPPNAGNGAVTTCCKVLSFGSLDGVAVVRGLIRGRFPPYHLVRRNEFAFGRGRRPTNQATTRRFSITLLMAGLPLITVGSKVFCHFP
jgi:hypothetical protein